MINRAFTIFVFNVFFLYGHSVHPQTSDDYLNSDGPAEKQAQTYPVMSSRLFADASKEKREYEEGDPFGKIKIRLKTDRWKKKKVEDDADNVLIENKDDYNGNDPIAEVDPLIIQDTPANSFAQKITSHKKIYRWYPKWHFSGMGGPQLPDAKISEDKTVLAIVETTGEKEGPNGSRIVLINTCNWQVLRIHEFKNRFISKICFIPNSIWLACWGEKQVSLKQPYSLTIINCRTGKEISSNKKMRTPISDLIATGTKLVIKPLKTKHLLMYNFHDLSFGKKVSCSDRQGVLATSANKLLFALGGDRFIEIFSAGGESLNKVKLPDGFKVNVLSFTANTNHLAAVSKDGNALYFLNKSVRTITDMAAGNILRYIPEEKGLAIKQMKKNEIVLYQIPMLKSMYSIFPGKLKPRTRADVTFLAFLPFEKKKYLVLDKHGNLYCLFKKGKRKWKKALVISAKNH